MQGNIANVRSLINLSFQKLMNPLKTIITKIIKPKYPREIFVRSIRTAIKSTPPKMYKNTFGLPLKLRMPFTSKKRIENARRNVGLKLVINIPATNMSAKPIR